jgi:hypothetical protein
MHCRFPEPYTAGHRADKNVDLIIDWPSGHAANLSEETAAMPAHPPAGSWRIIGVRLICLTGHCRQLTDAEMKLSS